MDCVPQPALSDPFAIGGAQVSRSLARLITKAAAVGGIVLLTWAGADVRVPLQPVPITLQTLFVLLAGALIGPGTGSLSQLMYLGLGVAGLPLFAGATAGIAVLAGPTGGYLLGFILAPAIVGRWIGRGTDYGRTLMTFAAASFAILALGVVHLALFYTHDFPMAVRVGFLPFLPGDALKVFAAASIYAAYRRLARRDDPA
jgi:biotin transport system substrate-specific component